MTVLVGATLAKIDDSAVVMVVDWVALECHSESEWFQQTKLPLPLTPAGILSEIVVFLHGMSPIMALLSDIQHAYDGGQLGGKSLKESL